MIRYMDMSQQLARQAKDVRITHNVPFRSCVISSLRVHTGSSIEPIRLSKVNGDWLIESTHMFIKALGIDKLIVVESTSQLHDVTMQLIDACAKYGISLIAEPHIVYHDTFPYRLILALAATVNGKELRFWASIDIELEV